MNRADVDESDPPPAAALGRRLFFDPVLSSNGRVSCATCHDPAKGYTSGGLAPRLGGGTLDRRAPSLLDRGAGRFFFWDGRVGSLEEQAIAPVGHPDEMGGPLSAAVARARAKYPQVRSAGDLAAALAAFERTIVSPATRWDDYRTGQNRLTLSDAEARGWDLFRGPARCYTCHTGRLLTDESFHATGVGTDAGRQVVTGLAADRGKFKTPGLRAVKLTGPYMHDASLPTLRDVVEHYNRGGGEARPLGLSEREKADLVAFLEGL